MYRSFTLPVSSFPLLTLQSKGNVVIGFTCVSLFGLATFEFLKFVFRLFEAVDFKPKALPCYHAGQDRRLTVSLFFFGLLQQERQSVCV